MVGKRCIDDSKQEVNAVKVSRDSYPLTIQNTADKAVIQIKSFTRNNINFI